MGCSRSVAFVRWPKRCAARQGARTCCIFASFLLPANVCRCFHGLFTSISIILGSLDECYNDDSTMRRSRLDVETVAHNVSAKDKQIRYRLIKRLENVDPLVSLNINRECHVQGQTRRVLVAQRRGGPPRVDLVHDEQYCEYQLRFFRCVQQDKPNS